MILNTASVHTEAALRIYMICHVEYNHISIKYLYLLSQSGLGTDSGTAVVQYSQYSVQQSYTV